MPSDTLLTPWPAHLVVATVVEQDGKYLLVHEIERNADGESRIVYNQPAGHWDRGESLFDAAIRETLEETGWRVQLDFLIGLYGYQSPFNGITYFRAAFAATPLARERTTLDADIIDAVWMTHEEIIRKRDRLRSPLVLAVINDYQCGKKFPLNIITHVR